jgi:hypothetical protein
LALLWRRNRSLAADNARLEARIEELGDRNWELKELAERSHTFLEALGDVIVRRGRRRSHQLCERRVLPARRVSARRR